MSTKTTHLELVKPATTEFPDVEQAVNGNMDILDAEVWKRGQAFNGEPVGSDGGFHISDIPYAENFRTNASQNSAEAFIQRSTGGQASLEDGDGWLTMLRGTYRHEGYVPQSITMTVSPMPREEGEDSISATIDDSVFVAYVQSSGTITLTYTTDWNASPALYGITVEGTPVAGDQIIVVYVKEVRGEIIQSSPETFVSTGWNLYDHTNGYAKVLKYSDTYGFKISGTYTALEFATTVSGSRTTITPVSGYFDIESDGYIFVTGGNATDTAIWMTWSDWTSGYNWDPSAQEQGDFAVYSKTEINLSTALSTYFPYGLLAVGSVADEVNINIGMATSNVLRLAYTASNLANAKASGRDYEYDEDYIYLARETPVTYNISIDGSYSAFDHGIEYFTGTSQAVYAETLYGANLKNKLERDVLTISQQTLSSAQQWQVRSNLGAASAADVSSLSDQIANLNAGDITASCTKNTDVITTVNVYNYGPIVIVTGSTGTNINGTGITLLTLPFTVKRAYANMGSYGGGFVGECFFGNGSTALKANISASSNNGSFCIVTSR